MHELGVCQISPQGFCIYSNEQMSMITGYSSEEMMGQGLVLAIHPEDRAGFDAGLTRCRENQEPCGSEFRILRRDGKVVWVNGQIAPFRGDEHRVLGYVCVISDITKRIHAENIMQQESMTEQYHFLQKLIDTIPNPLFYKDARGLFLGCNAAYESYTGLSRTDIIGKSIYDVYPSDLADIYLEKDLALLRESGVQIYESAFRVADGTRRDVVFHKAAYTTTDGAIAGLVGVVVDITERKRFQEYIEAEHRRLFSILEELPALVYLLGPDYSIHFSNRYFLDHIGTPGNRPCYEVLHKRKEPCENCASQQVFNSKSPSRWENGEVDGRIYEINAYPYYDIDGSQLVLVLGFDVTERKQAEEALRLLPATILILATDYSIRFANNAFCEQFGETSGKYCYEVIYQRKKPCEPCPVRQIFEKWAPDKWEHVSNGVTRQMYGHPFHDIYGAPQVLIMGIDISELKQLKEEMLRLDRLNLVGEMAAGIGHEIRNPMTTVRGFLQILEGKEDCAGYRGYFRLMIAELDRANAIISEYLLLAKDKAIKLVEKNLNYIVEALYPLIQADATRSGKTAVLALGEVANILLDEKEIRQLILNLARNGLEAMAPGGILTIRTYTEDEQIVLSVQDQGKGIKHDVLQKLGTPFFTTKDTGTGLGLAMCYSIATRHNAKIEVKTNTQGTIFSVHFHK